MSRDELRSVEIKHLRGSTNVFSLNFEKGKPLTIVYGENASGKSTICDAFELLGGRKIGSLEGRGLGTTTPYWASIGRAAGDIRVALRAESGEHVATVGKQGPVLMPPSDAPQVQVLRRGQILSLVAANESERFQAIARFIDVEAVETSEATIKAAAERNAADLTEALTRIEENRIAVENFWTQDGSPGTDSLTWARARVANHVDAGASKNEDAAILALGTAFDGLGGQTELLVQFRSEVAGAKTKLEETHRDEQEARDASTDLETIELLRAVSQYFDAKGETPVCPVCESAEHATGLHDRIKEKLDEHGSTPDYAELRRSAERAVSLAEAALARANEDAEKRRSTYEGADASQYLPAGVTRVGALPLAVDEWDNWLTENRKTREGWQSGAAARTERARYVATLQASLDNYDDNLKTATELQTLQPRLKRAHELVAETRHAFVDAILADISKEVGRLYDQIHPGEGLDKISLQLNPARRSSLKISSDFEGSPDKPPQAYFSDSHLDTLGLCIFIALAKRESPEGTILVLDDVLGSVDEPHVDRLVDLLYAEAAIFRHCIITTHYGPWKHKLRWGWLKNGQCKFIELGPWSAADGLTLSNAMPDLERLKALLGESPPDRQLVCAKAGVVLEAALGFLTQLYECAVPRKPEDRYTVGDLLPSIKGNLRTNLRVHVLDPGATAGVPVYTEVRLAPTLDRLQQIAEARNLFGCHFKEVSFQLLDSEAMEFGQLVVTLMETLTDAEAGWPKSDKSGEYWATAGETRRLHPLKRPQ